MLRAYLLQTGRQVSPFGDLAELQVHNEPLPQLQERVLRSAGCEVHRVDSLESVQTPCLIVHDDVFFTRAAVRRFIKAARRRPGNLQLALQVSLLTEAMVPELQGEVEEALNRAVSPRNRSQNRNVREHRSHVHERLFTSGRAYD